MTKIELLTFSRLLEERVFIINLQKKKLQYRLVCLYMIAVLK